MKLLPIFGGLSILLAPIVFSTTSLGDTNTGTTIFGFFYLIVRTDILGIEHETQETFKASWFEKNGTYTNFFGDYLLFAMVGLVLAIVSIIIGFRIKRHQSGRIGGLTTLLSSLIILGIRFLELSNNDRSFVYKESLLGVEFRYLEIPIAALLGMFFGIFALVKSQ